MVALHMKWVVTVQENVEGIFCTHLLIKAAILLYMDACDQTPVIVPEMHDPESLTLCWNAFSWWGRECFALSFYNKGGQFFVYDCIEPLAPRDYPRYTTNNCWPSIETHFQDEVGIVSLSLCARTAANTLFMTVLNLSHPQITHDTWQTIVDPPMILILRMQQGVSVDWCWLLRWPKHWKWTVMYWCQYFTIHCSISECDHKCETQNVEQ